MELLTSTLMLRGKGQLLLDEQNTKVEIAIFLFWLKNERLKVFFGHCLGMISQQWIVYYCLLASLLCKRKKYEINKLSFKY